MKGNPRRTAPQLVSPTAAGEVDLKRRRGRGWTALMMLAASGAIKKVEQRLLSHPHEIKERGWLGDNPLICAASLGHTAIVRLLIANGAEVDQAVDIGTTALMYAAWGGHAAVVRLLIAEGADVNKADEGDRTALRGVAWNGRAAVARLLITKGADVNRRGYGGCTPLIDAAASGQAAVVRLLIAKGAKVNVADDDGRTALTHAARNGRAAVVELLIGRGAQINGVEHSGGTALMAAAEEGHAAVVRLLIAKGAAVNHADGRGKTALIAAAAKGRAAVARQLIASGADVNKVDDGGFTALAEAARLGKDSVARVLLGRDPNTVIKDKHVDFALYIAKLHSKAFDKGQNASASDIARKSSHDNIVELLEHWKYSVALPASVAAATQQPPRMLRSDLNQAVKAARAVAVRKAKPNVAIVRLSAAYEVLVREGDLLNPALPDDERLRRAERLLRTYGRLRSRDPTFHDDNEQLTAARRIQKAAYRSRRKAAAADTRIVSAG